MNTFLRIIGFTVLNILELMKLLVVKHFYFEIMFDMRSLVT